MRRTLMLGVALTVALAAHADQKVTHHFESTVAAPAVRRVVIDLPAGEIKVRNSAGRSVSVSGFSRRDYDGYRRRAQVQEIVDDASMEVYLNRDEAIVRRRLGPNARGWRSNHFLQYEVTVEVPAGVAVEFQTSAGEVNMEGSFGDIDLDMWAGEITLRTPRADVRELNASCRIGEVNTHTGTELIEREGVFPGRTHFVNPAGGKSNVNVHVTTGEVNVYLTR
jgi:hypothetical protein